MKRIIRFLGGVTFAIILILLTAFFVILGTVLESVSDSHLFAARWTYNNPVFKLLLWLLSVNIIVAALRRWPFQWRHAPFLTAHVGLIMILSGTLIKAYFGTQGSMSLLEGSGSDQIVMLHDHVLTLYKRDGTQITFPVHSGTLSLNPPVSVEQYYPHHQMTYESWTSENFAYISGLAPIPFGEARTVEIGEEVWQIEAIQAEEITSYQSETPKIILARTSEGDHLFATMDQYGIRSLEQFPANEVSTVVVYDEGFGGYAIQNKIPLSRLNLNQLPSEIYNAAYWSMTLLDKLNETTKVQAPWKYLITSEEYPEQSLIAQMFSFAKDLPNAPEASIEEISKLQAICSRIFQSGNHFLETPLTPRFQPISPTKKLEENLPLLIVRIEDESIPIGFDRFGAGFKWPILQGKYLIHFHPKIVTIPHHVRMRQGREIDYPDSDKPFSYEADCLIDDEEVTLSMNHVHETWDGTRFYLANVSQNNGQSAKRVQLVVNHDPAKYWLTYPGGVIVALGMLMLWMRVSRKF